MTESKFTALSTGGSRWSKKYVVVTWVASPNGVFNDVDAVDSKKSVISNREA